MSWLREAGLNKQDLAYPTVVGKKQLAMSALRHPFLLIAVFACTVFTGSAGFDGSQRKDIFDDFIEDFEEHWSQFKKTFSKIYKEEEELIRKEVFRQNRNLTRTHNLQFQQGQKTYSLRLNQFADWSDEEYKNLNGFMPSIDKILNKLFPGSNFGDSSYEYDYPTTGGGGNSDQNLPDSIDWRKLGYVTSVKRQLHCGGCYSFAATGALEALHKRKTGQLVDLSQQNILDCSWSFGNHGCHGGLMTQAYSYVKANDGIDSLASYPYRAVSSHDCKYTLAGRAATDNGYVDVDPNEEALKAAVATVGPVSVGIMASLPNFKFYNSGIYSDPDCTSAGLDHGVLVVGYGSDPQGGDYWIVKNSWGPDWGMDGYIYIARNQGDMCGISSDASYPTLS